MVRLPYTGTSSSGVLDHVLKLRREVPDRSSFLLKLRELSRIHAWIKDDLSATELSACREGRSRSLEQRGNEPNEKKPTHPTLYGGLHRSCLLAMDCAVGVNGLSTRNGRCGVSFPGVSASQVAPILGPFGEIARAEPLDWPIVTIFTHHAPRLENVFLGSCADERK